VKYAAITAVAPAVRTFAQTLAAGLSTLTIVSLAGPELYSFGHAVVISTLSAVLAGVIAWLMNFAEALD
jgi:hypothetical protein